MAKRPSKKWRSKKWLRRRAKRNAHKMGKWRLEISTRYGAFWATRCKRCKKGAFVWLDQQATAKSAAARKRCKG